MYRTIDIRNFRGFKRFRLSQLGRVNLLVGTNNSGKTSILEAIDLVSSPSFASTLWNTLNRRGEHFWHEDEHRTPEVEFTHLFHGHAIELGQGFSITGHTEDRRDSINVDIVQAANEPTLFDTKIDDQLGGYAVRLLSHTANDTWSATLPLSLYGGVELRAFHETFVRFRLTKPPVRYISTSALSVDQVVTLFNEIVLTQDEQRVVDALRTIEPSIERIASVGTSRLQSGPSRGGIFIKCRSVSSRIPIGSMGDGIWRMLGLSLALVSSKNGILLVDEIDTGLHYSVMEDMWRLVKETAERLNVQVFATTHSRDCYESLANVVTNDGEREDDITIQRIERDKDAAIAFTNEEIVIAAERGLEVR
jgi:predicted ATPase